MYSLELDHIAVVARNLDEGTAFVEAILGVQASPGGRHPRMGTHNKLVGLGGDVYLEIIAVDPDAPKPKHRRWFNLDAYTGAPSLTNWICRTDDLDAAIEAAPPGSGMPMQQTRGDLTWTMAVPEFGRLPFDDASPALIEWAGGMHPARRLPDHGLRLTRLDVFHPEAEDLREAFPALATLDRVALKKGPEKRLIATIATPEGNRVLA